MITISLIPIVTAGFVSVLIGWVWFHPKVFGSIYMRIAGVTPEMQEAGKRRMPISIIVTLLASMLVAWVMIFVGNALNEFVDVISAIELGFWIWIGFVTPSMLGVVLWEQKPFRFFLINSIYWLINLIAIALILLIGGKYFSGVANTYDPNENTVQTGE